MSNILFEQYDEIEAKYALDMKISNQIKDSLSQFNEVLNSKTFLARENNKEIKLRIINYLKEEKKDCQAMLAEWSDLADDLIEINKDNLKNFNNLPKKDVQLLIASCFNEEDYWPQITNLINMWIKSDDNVKDFIESKFSYDLALIQITTGDFDRARYYLSIEIEEFIKVWKRFGGFSQASKHEIAGKIQKIQELKEFLSIKII